MLALPTTAILGRFGIGMYLKKNWRNGESNQGVEWCNPAGRHQKIPKKDPKEHRDKRKSLAVWNPDIFDLGGVFQEPSSFALFGVKPVDGSAFVRKNLFQVSRGKRFRSR